MNKFSPEIIVVGSHAPGLFLRVERVPAAGETVIGWDYQEPKDGGKGSNQAIAAARLGVPTAFVGCVGRDRLGDECERWLHEEGVDTTFLFRSRNLSTGVGFILLDQHGVPAMVTSMGANQELSPEQVDRAMDHLKGVKILLTQFEIEPQVALYAARAGRLRGLTTILNPAPASTLAGIELGFVDYLVPNESEARQMAGVQPDEAVDFATLASHLRHTTGAQCVLITLGEKGLAAVDARGAWVTAAPEVRVVDTSGAGDVFCAAFAAALAHGLDARAASGWACRAASLSVTRPGTIPAFPRIEEIGWD